MRTFPRAPNAIRSNCDPTCGGSPRGSRRRCHTGTSMRRAISPPNGRPRKCRSRRIRPGMPNSEVISHSFPWRVRAFEDLTEACQPRIRNADRLREIANELDRSVTRYGRASVAVTYTAFAELLRTVAMLVEWRAAIFAAEPEPDRFLKSALARHRQWETEYG